MKRISLILLLVLPAACKSSGGGGDGEGANADEYFYDCEDAKKPDGLTIYATDEAYRAFLDKLSAGAPKQDDTQAAKLSSPAADSTLSIATPPAFSLTAPLAMAPSPTRTTPTPHRLAPALHRRSRWAWVKDLFSIEGTAWAHCPNVTGPLYLVTVKEMGKTEATYSALASVVSFTPGAAWKTKLAPLMGKKVTVTVARDVFSTGEIQLGPFVPTQDPSFTVGP